LAIADSVARFARRFRPASVPLALQARSDEADPALSESSFLIEQLA
jgi:hypothetical protein